MDKQYLLIITLIMLVGFMVGLVKVIADLKTPRYIKPKSFLKIGDAETPLRDERIAPITITHHYITDNTSMFTEREELKC